jgi:hypothetical protein
MEAIIYMQYTCNPAALLNVVGYETAYKRDNRNKLWTILSSYNLPKILSNNIKAMHDIASIIKKLESKFVCKTPL